jgi:hypothetical protein
MCRKFSFEEGDPLSMLEGLLFFMRCLCKRPWNLAIFIGNIALVRLPDQSREFTFYSIPKRELAIGTTESA